MKASPVYLPVLRAKAAEFKALSDYQENPHRLVNVLPLFEPVPAQFLPSEDKPKPDVNDQLSSLVNRVFDSWGVTKPFLIDLRLLPKDLCTNDGQLVYAYIQNIAVPRGLSLRFVVPLWGELRPDHQQELVRITGSASDVSVGIRLAARRWIKATSVPQVDETLDRYRVTPSEVDLIVDYGKYDDSPSVSVASLLESMPYVDEWRTLVLLGGSFPVDLSDMTKNAMHRVPRPRMDILARRNRRSSSGSARARVWRLHYPTSCDQTRYRPAPAKPKYSLHSRIRVDSHARSES